MRSKGRTYRLEMQDIAIRHILTGYSMHSVTAYDLPLEFELLLTRTAKNTRGDTIAKKMFCDRYLEDETAESE